MKFLICLNLVIALVSATVKQPLDIDKIKSDPQVQEKVFQKVAPRYLDMLYMMNELDEKQVTKVEHEISKNIQVYRIGDHHNIDFAYRVVIKDLSDNTYIGAFNGTYNPEVYGEFEDYAYSLSMIIDLRDLWNGKINEFKMESSLLPQQILYQLSDGTNVDLKNLVQFPVITTNITEIRRFFDGAVGAFFEYKNGRFNAYNFPQYTYTAESCALKSLRSLKIRRGFSDILEYIFKVIFKSENNARYAAEFTVEQRSIAPERVMTHRIYKWTRL